MECPICIESTTDKNIILCTGCQYYACTACYLRYIFESPEDAHCMNCKLLFTKKYIKDKTKLNDKTRDFYIKDVWRKMKWRQYVYSRKSEDNLLNKIEPEKLKIVAVDALPEQLPYIEKGILNASFGQPTFRWGKVCVEKIVDKLHHNKEVEEINEMKLIKVNIENLGGWSRQLRAWGYKGIPDKYLVM